MHLSSHCLELLLYNAANGVKTRFEFEFNNKKIFYLNLIIKISIMLLVFLEDKYKLWGYGQI